MITWVCQICHQPIKNGTGYLLCPRDLYSVQQAWARFNQGRSEFDSVRFEDLAAMPGSVSWIAVHGACHDGPEPAYLIEIERIRTALHLLDWTQHLMRKGWPAEHTDWADLVQRVAKDLNGGRLVDA